LQGLTSLSITLLSSVQLPRFPSFWTSLLLSSSSLLLTNFLFYRPVLISAIGEELTKPDLAPTKIHQSCNITYILKGDTEQKKITLPAFGTVFLSEPAEGERGKGAIVKRFQVWIDVAPLAARGAELAALAAAK